MAVTGPRCWCGTSGYFEDAAYHATVVVDAELETTCVVELG